MAFTQFHNLLFDLDGTLVDSSPLHAQAFRHVLEVERPDLVPAFHYDPLKGLTTREAFVRLGIQDGKQLARCIAAKQAHYRKSVADGRLAPLPGARQLLQDCVRARRRLFLVTSGSAPSVRLALGSLDLLHLFEGVVTSDEVRIGKPAPDPFLYCLNQHHLETTTSVAIEDATSGVVSARAAGLAVIGVNNPQIATAVDWFFEDLPALRSAIGCIEGSSS